MESVPKVAKVVGKKKMQVKHPKGKILYTKCVAVWKTGHLIASQR